jgi:hypothetical protein
MRVEGEVHPVPFTFGALFTLVAIGSVVVVVYAGWVAVPLVIFFGGLGVLFGLECIPPWIEADDAGLSYRIKLRVRRVRWSEVAALGTGVSLGGQAPSLLVRLTPSACEARGFPDPSASFHLQVPSFEGLQTHDFIEGARERWERAGGSGATFDLLGDLRATGRTLRGALGQLRERARHDPEPPTAPDADATSGVTLHVRGDDGMRYEVVFGGDDEPDLLRAFRRESQRLAREHQYDPEFSGEIGLVINAAVTPDTPSIREALGRLSAELERGFASSRLRTTRGSPIRVTWRYGHEAPSGVVAGAEAGESDPFDGDRELADLVTGELARALDIIEDARAGPLIPVAVTANGSGGWMHQHFVDAASYPQSVAGALELARGAKRPWAVLWDGYLTQGGERTDAIFVCARGQKGSELRFARRYRRVGEERRAEPLGEIVPLHDG